MIWSVAAAISFSFSLALSCRVKTHDYNSPARLAIKPEDDGHYLSQHDEQRVHSMLKKTKLSLRRDSFSTFQRQSPKRKGSHIVGHPWQNDLFVATFSGPGFSTAVWSKVLFAGVDSCPSPLPRCGHSLTVVDMAPTSCANTST